MYVCMYVYQVEHEKRNSISTNSHAFCLIKNMLITTFLMIFERFPNTFRKLPKIPQKLSEDQTVVSENCGHSPTKNRWCFDHTGTTLSTFKGLCNHGNADLFTSENNMLFSRLKMSCLRTKAHVVFHWC